MTTLRSNMKVELTKQRQRRHRSAAPAKPKPQPTKRSTRKTKATPNISARPSRPHSGDSPQALRAKRRWVQQEFDAGRLSGKVTRELHDLYNKNTIGEPQLQETLALSLTDAAKAAKHRLEETFNETSGAGSVADVMSGILGDSSSSAGKIFSATRVMVLILTSIKRPERHLTAELLVTPAKPARP